MFPPFIVVVIEALFPEVPSCALDQFDIEEGVDPISAFANDILIRGRTELMASDGLDELVFVDEACAPDLSAPEAGIDGF